MACRSLRSTDDPLDGALEIGAGRSPTVVQLAEGERHYACGVVYSVKACGSVRANAYTLIEAQIAPGGIMPSHRHAAFEEGIYVLEGSIRATLDGETYEVAAGSFLIIPWGLPHDIAEQCGFGNAERMRRTFQRLFDISPQDYGFDQLYSLNSTIERVRRSAP